jgi:hypothetical protein
VQDLRCNNVGCRSYIYLCIRDPWGLFPLNKGSRPRRRRSQWRHRAYPSHDINSTFSHDPITPQIVPLLSQSSHPLPFGVSSDEHAALVKRVQFGGDEVVKAKDGAGSATLSMAYAGAEFAAKVLRALKGEKGIIAPSYVNLSADKTGGDAVKKEIGEDLEYFSSNVELGVSIWMLPELYIQLLIAFLSLRVLSTFVLSVSSQMESRL